MLCRLALYANQANLSFVGVGCDLRETACRHARQEADRWLGEAKRTRVEFVQLNCLHDELPSDFDVVLCSLLLHHLHEADAVRLMVRMRETARLAVLIDDLLRSQAGYWLAWLGTRVLTRSRIVHVDGPLSVKAAFTLDEVQAMAEAAGMTTATIARHWPFRYLLEWRQ